LLNGYRRSQTNRKVESNSEIAANYVSIFLAISITVGKVVGFLVWDYDWLILEDYDGWLPGIPRMNHNKNP
jgi:hypothetical protein